MEAEIVDKKALNEELMKHLSGDNQERQAPEEAPEVKSEEQHIDYSEQEKSEAPKEETEEKEDKNEKDELKEFKKKYNSTVSQMKKEIARLAKEKEEMQSQYSKEDLSAIEKHIEYTFQRKEAERLEKAERETFVSKHPEFEGKMRQIDSIIKEHPSLSYEAAKTLWQAHNDPQSLMKANTNAPITGKVPKTTTDPYSDEKMLRQEASKEMAKWMARSQM